MNKKNYLFVTLLLIVNVWAQNPCGNLDLLTVNDTSLCDGQTLVISAISGFPNYSWSSGSSNELVSISSPGTYTVSTNYTTNNLVTNGDFSSGNTNFNSSYNYSTNNLYPEGVYTVTTNPNFVHNGFTGSGEGNFMVVNGSTSPGTQVWCQDIEVQSQSNYDFSSEVTTVAGGNEALLQFSINGEVIGTPFSAPSSIGGWDTFNAMWNSGINTVAEICIINQNIGGGGNDFGLDEITFTTLCESSESIEVSEVEIANATIFPQDSLCETQNSIILSAVDPGGIWSGPGIQNELTGLFSPFNAGPGIHSITYTIEGICGDQNSQNISIVQELSSFISEPSSMCINESEIQLEGLPGIGTWTGTGITNTQDGIFNPTEAILGTNQITYTPFGFCVEQSSVSIDVFDYIVPEAELLHYICFGQQIRLELDDNYLFSEYEWSNGRTNSAIFISDAGEYTLQITDENDCMQDINFNVYPRENCESIIMPNIFTPNQDYINDLFTPIEYEYITAANIRIFNRWGSELYFSSEVEKGWDGNHFSKPCPNGVYFWIINLQTNTGNYQSMNGVVQLVR
jgi:gliding motility-associated-like protein